MIVALLAPLALGACSQNAPVESEPDPQPTATGQSAEEMEALYRARTDSARMHFTEADVRFMTGMIHHHAQAIEISALAPTNDASAPVQRLAARITNAQRDEIATMQRWLRARGQPTVDLEGHGTHDAVRMPGMLTPEQIRELEGAGGTEFDRLFLTYMIQHHQGAVTMVNELFATDGAGQDEEVFKFASDAQVDQATEVARMELMLTELPYN